MSAFRLQANDIVQLNSDGINYLIDTVQARGIDPSIYQVENKLLTVEHVQVNRCDDGYEACPCCNAIQLKGLPVRFGYHELKIIALHN